MLSETGMHLTTPPADNQKAKGTETVPLSFLARRSPLEQVVRKVWCFMAVADVAFALMPVRFTLLRLGLIAGAILLWVGAVYLARRSRPLLVFLSMPPLLVAAVLFAPGRPADPDRLRAEYVRTLESLHGVPYVWGGETRIAVDCSGLVRYALIEAALKEGIRTGNAGLIRYAASLSYHDCSAKALGENYRDTTETVGAAHSLNEADYTTLRPGDLAVLDSGLHVLAYAGSKRWIQADPTPMRVIISPAPNAEGWFTQRVQFVRWRVLESPGEPNVALAPSLPHPR